MQVRDVLNTKGRGVYTLGPDASVGQAIALLAEHNIGSLPIVDADGRLVGIFTERDVLRGVNQDCEGFHKKRLDQAMTRDPVTCDLEDDVNHVMGKMSEHRVGQLPVLGEGRLVGVVSVGDVIKVLYDKVDTENRHLMSYIYGSA